jgi:polyhydroxyalkanoate synthesis regulator phasin
MASSSGSNSSSESSSSSKKRSSGKKSSAAAKSSSKSSAARKRAASKAGKASGRKRAAKKTARSAATAATRPAAQASELSGKNVAEFRQALSNNLIRPLELVMLSRARIEDALDEVVRRGRMTRDDATQLGQALYILGRQQTEDVMKDLEELLGRGRSKLEGRRDRASGRAVDAAAAARRQVGQATAVARRAADPLLTQADRARRAAGVGPSFPILGYEDLTAAQIQARLITLTAPELRKVRDYERRRGNRKSVLDAIESKLT